MSAWQSLDEAALLFLQEHVRSNFLTALMRLFTHLGDAGLIWIAAALVLLVRRSTRRQGAVYAAALAFAAAVNNLLIKNLVARPRPYDTVEALEVLIPKLDSYSFPSGHACSSFAAATALTLLFPRRGAWSFVPAALIAFSRPYLGVHYVSDVLCGAVLGTVCAAAVVYLSRRYSRGGRMQSGRIMKKAPR